jgi:beta-glucosidase
MENEGGWANPKSVEYFRSYASHLARGLGDLVDHWTAINEPTAYASACYMLEKFPPQISDMSKYQDVLRNMLLATAHVYHDIHDILGKNRSRSSPKVGTVKDMEYFQPYNENNPKDRNEATFLHQFYNASFLDALKTGNIIPPIGVGEHIDFVKDAFDFLGFNYYSRQLVKAGGREILEIEKPLARKDSLGLTDMGYEIYPEGIYHLIKWLKDYGKPIYITENGVAVQDDERRAMSIILHLEQVHRAIREGADVRAYLYWSLIDNFEWDSGFDKKFGLVEVDHGTQQRKPRPSAYVYKEIIENNGIRETVLSKYKRLAAR